MAELTDATYLAATDLSQQHTAAEVDRWLQIVTAEPNLGGVIGRGAEFERLARYAMHPTGCPIHNGKRAHGCAGCFPTTPAVRAAEQARRAARGYRLGTRPMRAITTRPPDPDTVRYTADLYRVTHEHAYYLLRCEHLRELRRLFKALDSLARYEPLRPEPCEWLTAPQT